MKKQQNKLDEYFREALQDHTVVPSEAAREAFLKEAAALERGRKSRKYLYFYLAALLLIVTSGAGLLLMHPEKSKPASSVSSTTNTSSYSNGNHENKNNSFIPTKQSESASSINSEIISQNSGKNKQLRSRKNNQHIAATRDHQSAMGNESVQPEATSSSPEKITTQNDISRAQTNSSSAESHQSPITQPDAIASYKSDSLKSTPAKKPDTSIIEKTSGNDKKRGSDPNSRKWDVALGGYYAPEWMFNTLEGEKYVNNFGIEGTLHFGKYSIRTGAGLSVTKGTNEISINYNDYLGHYNKLDSIHFAWNPNHSSLVPTFYFTSENVWDSLMKTADAKVVKRYTYLQIPLILGYDFWQNDHFSLGLRAGPILSVLLKTEVLSDNYDPGMNKIILINRITPERIQTNWQILGGFNATYRFSKRFGFELEPEIRYYFNSVYEKSAIDKKPWSVGIHAAFIVIL